MIWISYRPRLRAGAESPDYRWDEQHERQPAAARYLIAPFPVSPSGGKRGAPPPPLRYGSGKAPAQSRTLISVLGRKGKGLLNWGCAPKPPRSSSEEQGLLYAINRTDRSLIKPDNLTC